MVMETIMVEMGGSPFVSVMTKLSPKSQKIVLEKKSKIEQSKMHDDDKSITIK